MSIKKVFTTAAISVALMGAAISPSFAAGSSGSQAVYCGATHGAFADENGNFGSIGYDYHGTPGYHGGAVGQQSGATGYNNSNVDCNPQN